MTKAVKCVCVCEHGQLKTNTAHHLFCCCAVQVYHQVHQMLPDVHYNALAKILILKTPGKRKQERLPGKYDALHLSILQSVLHPPLVIPQFQLQMLLLLYLPVVMWPAALT